MSTLAVTILKQQHLCHRELAYQETHYASYLRKPLFSEQALI